MAQQSGIRKSTDALARAIELTHLDQVSRKTSIRETTVGDDTVPFLSPQLAGRTAWNVEFEGGALALKSSTPRNPDRYADQRTFSVLIDEKTGQLLSVRCKYSGAAGAMRPEPSTASAEKQLRGMGEVYLGLPTVDPKVTFLDAVNAILAKGVDNAHQAKEIDGLYLLHSKLGSKPRAVWIVMMRGLPSLPVSDPDADLIESRRSNFSRILVDAMTGTVLFAVNSPQPDPRR